MCQGRQWRGEPRAEAQPGMDLRLMLEEACEPLSFGVLLPDPLHSCREPGRPMAPGSSFTAGSVRAPSGACLSTASTPTGDFQAEGEGRVHHAHLQPPAR